MWTNIIGVSNKVASKCTIAVLSDTLIPALWSMAYGLSFYYLFRISQKKMTFEENIK